MFLHDFESSVTVSKGTKSLPEIQDILENALARLEPTTLVRTDEAISFTVSGSSSRGDRNPLSCIKSGHIRLIDRDWDVEIIFAVKLTRWPTIFVGCLFAWGLFQATFGSGLPMNISTYIGIMSFLWLWIAGGTRCLTESHFGKFLKKSVEEF